MASCSCSPSPYPFPSYVPTPEGMYDVYLSFRGEDTRFGFVDHLYAALVQRGIYTFKDDIMLLTGTTISPERLKAIEESRFAVVVLSKNYAISSWCLEELAKIMECRDSMIQKVLPVFYHVDRSDVRKQKGDFASAFQEHEDKFKGEMDIVKKWREALVGVANLSGYHISAVTGGEVTVIEKIVQDSLGHVQPRGKENSLIGIESHIEALNSLMGMERAEEVRVIGIHGMGGIGKTTIAQALFREIAHKFEGSSFVEDVRENSSSKRDICLLQEKILQNILPAHHRFKIQDPEYGAYMLRERCCNRKVLLVLDDVDNQKQLKFLAATHECFGRGSRIVITTSDERLLLHADAKYKPTLLLMDQAIELFSRHAFRKISPPDGYEELSIRAIRCTGRLPLALKVVGSFFCGRQAHAWESALDRLAKKPNVEIFETLKLSFDDLTVLAQEIFLDIACFFKGKDVEDVARVLDSFGFYSKIGFRSLFEKSLITVSKKRLDMHDLIQEMGWQIVRETAPNSRIWKLEKNHDFIWTDMDLEKIEAIVMPNKQNNVHRKLGFHANVFKSMKNVRLLDIYSKFTSCEPTIFPDKLRWLCWNQYPFSSLPLADNCELIGLEMHGGNIEHLWTGRKVFSCSRNMGWLGNHGLKQARQKECVLLEIHSPSTAGVPKGFQTSQEPHSLRGWF